MKAGVSDNYRKMYLKNEFYDICNMLLMPSGRVYQKTSGISSGYEGTLLRNCLINMLVSTYII